jgi:transcriptional regulator with XRE-family HTH domain
MGINIKAAISRHNLTSKEVASRLQMSEVGFSNHVTGNPTIKVLNKIASAIGCDVSELFDKQEHTPTVLICPKCNAEIAIEVKR